MKIGIDLDGVLADIVSLVLYRLNMKYKTRFLPSDVKNWNGIQDLYNITEEEMHKWMNSSWIKHWEMIVPEDDTVVATMNTLYKDHSITIITKRYKETYHAVLLWLEENKIKYDNLVFITDKADKLSYPIDLLIDDKPNIFDEIDRNNSQHYKAVLMRTQPWNENIYLVEYKLEAQRISCLAESLDWLDGWAKSKKMKSV